VTNEKASRWLDEWLGPLIVGVFVVGLVVFGLSWVYSDHLETKAHEARCLQARVEILRCMEINKTNYLVDCSVEPKIRYRCTEWPRSWEGR